MRELGHSIQTIPFGKDNWVSIARPKPDAFQRKSLSISNDTNLFNMDFQTLGNILQHCKRALLAMKRSDGTLRPFPEDEFTLHYGKPSCWNSWFDLAKFAEYKVVSEGFLNKDSDDWSAYAYKLREWSLNQGHLHLDDPKINELVPNPPTGLINNFFSALS